MKYSVPFIKPDLPPAEYMTKVYDEILESNWFTNFGPFEKKLCDSIERYIGQDVSVTTVSNATTGLMLAMKALAEPTSQKNQVLLPSFTFAAVPESVIWCNLEPVFIDIDKKTWQPDLECAGDYLKKNRGKVAAILFCNIFGVGAKEIGEWEKLAESHGIPLVIDSAAGFGSKYPDDVKLGGKGSCEIFSFHATKPFSIGEGGLVSSKSADLIKKIRSMSNFGFNNNKEAVHLGLNGKLEEINAAIGLWQLARIDKKIAKRQELLEIYKNELSSIGFEFQENSAKSTVGFVSAVAHSPELIRGLVSALRDTGIEANSYYNPALHEHKLFKGLKKASDLKNTKDISSRAISLPAHNMVNEEIISRIKSTILLCS